MDDTFREVAAPLKLFMDGLKSAPVFVQEAGLNRKFAAGKTLVCQLSLSDGLCKLPSMRWEVEMTGKCLVMSPAIAHVVDIDN